MEPTLVTWSNMLWSPHFPPPYDVWRICALFHPAHYCGDDDDWIQLGLSFSLFLRKNNFTWTKTSQCSDRIHKNLNRCCSKYYFSQLTAMQGVWCLVVVSRVEKLSKQCWKTLYVAYSTKVWSQLSSNGGTHPPFIRKGFPAGSGNSPPKRPSHWPAAFSCFSF